MIKFDEFYYGSFDGSQEQRGVIDISYNLTAGQQKGGTPSINVLISGVSPLTLLNAVKLNYIKAFGKCEQDLTPTPTSPVDIIANNGAIKAFCGNKWTDVNKLSGYIIQNQSGVIQANSNYNVSAPIFLKAGDYSVSYYVPSIGTRPFTIWECDAQGDLVGKNYIFNITRPNVGTNTGTFTIDRDMYVRISWRNDFTDIVVAPTTAIIYYDGTQETIQAKGKNLFDRATVGIGDGAIASATGKNTGSSSRCRTIGYVPVNPNTTYTISAVINGYAGSNSAGIFVLEYTASSGDFESNYTGTYSGWQNPSGYSFTTGATTYGIRLVFGWSISGEISPSDVSNIQLELGSTATTYEPYFVGNTVTCQPLLSVGDYKDVQNITNGAITRNVGIKVLDGTEDWTASGNLFYAGIATDALEDTHSCYCTHFKGVATNASASYDNEIKVGTNATQSVNWTRVQMYPVVDTYSNVTAFKQWLADQYNAGTPVIIVYPLANPTTETTTPQSLPIVQGNNIVEATGSLNGLEMEISYKTYDEGE